MMPSSMAKDPQFLHALRTNFIYGDQFAAACLAAGVLALSLTTYLIGGN